MTTKGVGKDFKCSHQGAPLTSEVIKIGKCQRMLEKCNVVLDIRRCLCQYGSKIMLDDLSGDEQKN